MTKYILPFFIFTFQFSYAIGVASGTEIRNTAYLNYVLDDNITINVKSNELIDLVDQKLDMKLVCEENDVVMVEAGTTRAMSFHLQNYGNGEDTYTFTPIKGEKRAFEVDNPAVYLDDGDGVFSLSADTLVTELNVPADGNVSLFFVSDIPPNAKDESSNGILATSQKQGDLGYGEFKKLDNHYVLSAVEEGANQDTCTYKVPTLLLKLEKKATLSSQKLFRGTTIHYELILTAKGRGVARGISIDDVFPEGTVYVENSLRLDGKSVQGASTTGVSVAVEDIEKKIETTEAVPYHHVTFDVRVL